MKASTLLFAAFAALTASAQSLTQFVDPLIGSGGHGHVFVGANVPYGLVQAGPTSVRTEWDWCSGYHRSDSTIIGFSQTHLSGTGIGDLFDVTIMPVVGEVKYARGKDKEPGSGLWSYADRSKEEAKAGYYRTHLRRYGIDAEMTATERVGVYRFTYPASSEAALVVDLENGGCWDKATQTYIEQAGKRGVRGFRYSTGWAKKQKIYFYAELSHDFSFSQPAEHYARLSFETKAGEEVLVKVALSPTSMAEAERNMSVEAPSWNFNEVCQKADAAWNKELARIQVESSSTTDKRILYTALYHTMVAPSVFSDAGVPNQAYTTMSLWDTYRAAHPLMTIINPERAGDVVRAMVDIYKKDGKLPVWHLVGNETDCMVGNPGICVVADAYLKGLYTDKDAVMQALVGSANLKDRAQKEYHQFGYIPFDTIAESVAMTMEYGIADWCVAQAALKAGDKATYEKFLARSKAYKHYFDPETQFMRGKDSKGNFRTPFNPFSVKHRDDDYCEGNAWQYTWLVPHDLDGLVKLFGGKRQFLHKFDSLFIATGDLGKDASPDVSGLIGQYAHGNEPSHHITYFYSMLGLRNRTADLVRKVLKEQYRDAADGLTGNEDVGQMSAWYLLSSLGFYQVEPAGGRYYFGSPLFQKATLQVRDGIFTILAPKNSDKNRYIRSIKLNGKRYNKPYIAYEDIARGGTLEFEMSDR